MQPRRPPSHRASRFARFADADASSGLEIAHAAPATYLSLIAAGQNDALNGLIAKNHA